MIKKVALHVVLLAIIASSAWAQSYEATIQQSIIGTTLNVDLYLETTTDPSANLGDVTLTISYNSSALTFVGKDASNDGRWDDGSSTSYQDIFDSSNIPRAGLNVQKTATGSGLDIPETPTLFGRLTFTIIDGSANSDIQWSSAFSDIRDWDGASIKGAVTFTNPGDYSLPVELSVFSAEPVDEGVKVSWVTQSETDNVGFILERSSVAQEQWVLVASYQSETALRGHGNSSQLHAYEYVDREAVYGQTVQYRLSDVNRMGQVHVYDILEIELPERPMETVLEPAFPNPFNPVTKFNYHLAKSVDVSLTVVNVLGQRVRTLIEEPRPMGSYNHYWDGRDDHDNQVPSGIYLLVMKAGEVKKVQKIMLAR